MAILRRCCCCPGRRPGRAACSGAARVGVDSAHERRQAGLLRHLADARRRRLRPRAARHAQGRAARPRHRGRRRRFRISPSALERRKKNFAARATADPRSKCFTLGTPRGIYGGEPFQIFQRPRDLTIVYQFGHPVRTIHTNGTRHPEGALDFWLGDSRATWEGDTLVVDVTQFNGETWLDRVRQLPQRRAARRRALELPRSQHHQLSPRRSGVAAELGEAQSNKTLATE